MGLPVLALAFMVLGIQVDGANAAQLVTAEQSNRTVVGQSHWCRQYPTMCRFRSASNRRVSTLDLAAANDRVNKLLTTRSDQQLFGVEERWEVKKIGGRFFGDCEEYALLKQQHLVLNMGMSTSDARIAFVYNEVGTPHFVLVATVDGQDWVLDQERREVLPVQNLQKFGYEFVLIQSHKNPRVWMNLERNLRISSLD